MAEVSVRSQREGRGEPAWAFAYIVVPVFRRMFGPGEVTRVRVAAEASGSWSLLTLEVGALGDSSRIYLWDSESHLYTDDLVDLRLHLADQLQDLIAESPYGWGQLRTFARSDFT